MRYTPRHGVDFEWSKKSWTHNVFRAWEMVFGRKFGVRAEMFGYLREDGKSINVPLTLEAHIALFETFVRNLFTFKFPYRIYIPILATPSGFPLPASPFLFAIAYDNSVSGESTSAQSTTFAFTVTGSNTAIGFGGQVRKDITVLISSFTYNSASATIIAHVFENDNNNMDTASAYLASTATGSNNIVCTANESACTNVTCLAISMSGADSAPLGTNTTKQYTSAGLGTTNAPSATISTVADGSLVLSFLQCNSGAIVPSTTGTNQTAHPTPFHSSQGDYQSMSTQTTTTAGSYTSSWSTATTDNLYHVWEMKASTGAGVTPARRLLTLLGVT